MIYDELKKLPSNRDMAVLLGQVSTQNREALTLTRTKIAEWYQELSGIMDYIKSDGEEDYNWEPEHLYKLLSTLKEAVGGMQGVVAAVNRRAKFLAFEDISANLKQVGEAHKPYTDKEKEMYARGVTADLDGLEKSLEQLFSTLDDRIWPLRSSVKGGWF